MCLGDDYWWELIPHASIVVAFDMSYASAAVIFSSCSMLQDNIQQFLTACKDLGLKDTQLFDMMDLREPTDTERARAG